MDEAIIYVIDDEPDVRAAIALLLKSVGHHVQEFDSALEFWQLYQPEQPCCLILDVRMPGMSGIELQQYLNRLDYNPPIIMISGHGEIPMAVKAIKSGAIDFLQKPFSDQLLIDHVKFALEQDQQRRAELNELNHLKSLHAKLTPREKEVLNGVVKGKLNKIIASEMNVSTRTVEIHRAHVMEKMEVNNLSSLVRSVSELEKNGILDAKQ